MNLFISDIHFGHRNVIEFDHRPFVDVEEMDRTLIKLWNGRVSPEDDVYVIGDFAYRNERSEEWYLRQLRGRKHLIIGNHDGKLLGNEKAMSYFDTVEKMMHVTDQGEQLQLCHFPIADWNGMHHGSYLIHGHIHNRRDDTYEFMKKREKALNAGCMINGYTPVSLRELIRNNERYKG